MSFKNREIDLEDVGKRVLISVPSRVNKYPKGEFAMFLQPSFLKLAQNQNYSASARLLFFYMAVAEYDNRIKKFTQQEISETLNIARPNISKANKVLESDGVIYKDGHDYYFSEDFILKGVRKYKATTKKEDEESEDTEE